jgi:hypothetical protein
MQEQNLFSKKKQANGISVEGVSESSFIKSSAAVVKNSDGSWTIPVTEFLRIPYVGSPYPIGENMEIILRGRITTDPRVDQAFYLLGKWRTITGDGELDIKRRIDAHLSFDIGSVSENTEISTTSTVPVNQDFEIHWVHQGTQMNCTINGVLALTTSVAAMRQRPVDWVLGGYLNQNNDVQASSRASWTVYNLTIKRLSA